MGELRIVRNRFNGVRRTYIPLFALMIALTPRGSAAQGVPLQASDAQVTQGGRLQYSLTNAATQPATAWSVIVAVADLNGTVVGQTVITLDEYRVEAQRGIISENEIRRSLLRPRQTRRFELPGPFDARLLVTVTPAAMVFLDGTSVGDAGLIASIFDRRAAERDARAEVLRQLLDIQTHYVGAAALKEAIARLSRSATPDPDHARRACQEDLREALTQAEANHDDPMKALARQIEIVRREYEAAVQHSMNRKEH
jgi:hypothetical protein